MTVDLQSLLTRVVRLEAAEAAREVLYGYAAAVDTRDWATLRDCFDDEAFMALGASQKVGAADIVASLRDMLPEGFVTQHLLVNPRVVANDGETVVIDSTVYYLHEGRGYEAVGWGTYRDTIAVTDGRGRIVRKEFSPLQHLPGSVATMGARVAHLETLEAARRVTWQYATAVDGPDLALLRETFADDAVLVSRSGAKEGRDAMLAYYAKALDGPTHRKHLLTNQEVVVTGPGEATVTSYFAYTYAGAAESVLGWGTYVDRVRVVNGRGAIVEKRITIDASGDVAPGWATGV